MRFNNNTNIPNKFVQAAVNSINETNQYGFKVKKPEFTFVDAYGNKSETYRVTIEGFPTMIIKDNGKFCDVTTVGNEKFYNVDPDGRKIVPEVKTDDKKKKRK